MLGHRFDYISGEDHQGGGYVRPVNRAFQPLANNWAWSVAQEKPAYLRRKPPEARPQPPSTATHWTLRSVFVAGCFLFGRHADSVATAWPQCQ
jgi:hypothetical protein